MPTRGGATGSTLRVEGYRDVMRGFADADRKTKREQREALRRSGSAVQAGAASRISRYSAQTAAGYKTRVRQTGVAVEQSLRKTTGTRPDWGSFQMRHALLPSMVDNEAETIRLFEEAMDEVCRGFNRGFG